MPDNNLDERLRFDGNLMMRPARNKPRCHDHADPLGALFGN